ncbi:hypothetical protein LJK88_01775 [Paenibacillus sp. P26]|nr:hypothetical protein LJK88_01775 [Paenibacillus sp. P26]
MNATIGVPPFDFYDNNDWPELELSDVLLHFLYPPFAYLFVYLYDRWNIRGISLLVYILGFSLFGIGFEVICDWAGVYQYKKWNLWCSFAIYIYNQSFLLLYFRMLLNHYKKAKLRIEKLSQDLNLTK